MANLETHIGHLARNNHWSNHRLYGACSQLSDAEYFLRRPSFFGSIHATLNHIVITDMAYLGRLTGTNLVDNDADILCEDIGTLRRKQYETDGRLIDYCERADATVLGSVVAFQRQDGNDYHERVDHLLLHLFVHQVHHRGQVHGMLSATEVAPPQLDEYFLDGDEARRRAELEELGL